MPRGSERCRYALRVSLIFSFFWVPLGWGVLLGMFLSYGFGDVDGPSQ